MDFSNFTPNKDILDSMISMGITKEIAEIALYNTGNESCDAAVSFVFDNPNDESFSCTAQDTSQRRQRRRKLKTTTETTTETLEHDHMKMVFVVNSALEMSIGKTAAQVAHACLGLYRNLTSGEEISNDLDTWENAGEKKIVLSGTHDSQLMELKEKANVLSLYTYLVQDAGHTEVPPGSVTVLGIFGKEDIVDGVTGELHLLR